MKNEADLSLTAEIEAGSGKIWSEIKKDLGLDQETTKKRKKLKKMRLSYLSQRKSRRDQERFKARSRKKPPY
ncbi:uncharacterized protein DS421_15g493230 [Arachis hypogaea]|nr:uncharacterized protein DS421_15g493230 [Arachis hypogaea]